LIAFPEGARVISWLPAAHIAERAAPPLPTCHVFGFCGDAGPVPAPGAAFVADGAPNWFFCFAVPLVCRS